jgi:hypothetical protein
LIDYVFFEVDSRFRGNDIEFFQGDKICGTYFIPCFLTVIPAKAGISSFFGAKSLSQFIGAAGKGNQ